MEAVKIPEEKQKRKTGQIINPVTMQCKICGKDFLKTSVNKETCSKECSKINHDRYTKEWYWSDVEYRRQKLKESQRKYRKKHPKRICVICGEIIPYEPNKKARMHEECVYKDCLKTLGTGEHLSTTQIQRLAARGYTMKEFIHEYFQTV